MHINESFWLLVSFVLFFALTFKHIRRFFSAAISRYQNSIDASLKEAMDARAMSEVALQNARKKESDVDALSREIIKGAHDEVARIKADTKQKIDEYTTSRIASTDAKIMALETAIINNLKSKIVSDSLEVVKRYLVSKSAESISVAELKSVLERAFNENESDDFSDTSNSLPN